MAEKASSDCEVEVAGVRTAIKCSGKRSLLESMIATGSSPVRVGCRSGGCGVCRIRVHEGRYETRKMSRSRISEQDEAEGIVLACRIFPQTDVVVEPMPLKVGKPKIARAEGGEAKSGGAPQ